MLTNPHEAIEVLTAAANAAGAVALKYFKGNVQVDIKADHSPVTVADKEAEAAVISVISARFPEHTFLGEESGERGTGARCRWIIDPIDGTKGFIRGLPFWGPLIALEEAGEVVAGCIAMPALGELYVGARGLGAFDKDGGRMQVSSRHDWSQATLSIGELPRLLKTPQAQGVLDLVRTAQNVRSFGDVAASVLVLRGQAEAYLEAGVQLWDLAAHKLLVEEAGGVFTDLSGHKSAANGTAIISNGLVHEQVLATLNS